MIFNSKHHIINLPLCIKKGEKAGERKKSGEKNGEREKEKRMRKMRQFCLFSLVFKKVIEIIKKKIVRMSTS